MGLYTANFKAYVQQPGARLFPAVRITWPDGSIERISTVAASSPDGIYEDRIEPGGIDDIDTAVDYRQPGLQALSTNVRVKDIDRRLMKRLEGALDCRRSAATVYWGSPDLALADWHVHLAGILASQAYRDGKVVELTVRTDERWLTDSKIPKFPLTKNDAGDVPDTSIGIYLPTVMGSHDGQSLSGKGFMPTVRVRYVAGTTCWDLVTHGQAKSAPRVYLNGALKTAGVHYDLITPIVAGKWFTAIQWRAGNIPAAGDVVQCDVDGLTADTTPTGVLVTNPVSQIRLWLVNFAWGSWKLGAWLSESGGPLDATSWAASEALASLFKLEGAFRVGGDTSQKRAIDELNDWLGTWRMFRPYWTPAGKLALGYIDTAWPGYGNGDAFDLVRQEEPGVGVPVATDDDTQLCARVSATHLYEAATGKSWGSLDVEDVSRAEQVSENIQMLCGAARF